MRSILRDIIKNTSNLISFKNKLIILCYVIYIEMQSILRTFKNNSILISFKICNICCHKF